MCSKQTFVEIVLNLKINKSFTYLVPEELKNEIAVGKRVLVSFVNRKRQGYVVDIHQNIPKKSIKIKEIISIIGKEPVITIEMLKLSKWIADYYFSSWGMVLAACIPILSKPKQEKYISLSVTEDEAMELLKELNQAQKKIIYALLNNNTLREKELCYQAEVSNSPLKTLTKNKIIKIEYHREDKALSSQKIFPRSKPLSLTPEQKAAFDSIISNIDNEEFKVFLLQGITGSGKTEVYMQAIAKVILKGKQAIVLTPEISLTPQMVERFKSRFGEEVAILHSRLSSKKRNEEWNKIKSGKVSIAIGARSAVFAPFFNLGLIVVDEEHENTYKQNNNPRYNARDVAVMRAKFTSSVVILGSATPSFESIYNAQKGKYQLLELSCRIDNRSLPKVELVDLREEIPEKSKSLISFKLQEAMKERLQRKEQIILFLNRRGFSTYIQCTGCGEALSCKYCNVTLTYHLKEKTLRCHYCGNIKEIPSLCPYCESKKIKYFGVGTQKIEKEINRLFPQARIARLDVDVTKKKDALENILHKFNKGAIDILIGTQMIAKGLDIPKVTLVGVISADTSLNLPDYRAAERTFNLLTQVAGRAGRGDLKGEVLIQTFNPDQFCIQSAIKQDYNLFYQQEIKNREALWYPPFSHLVNIILQGKEEAKVEKAANKFCQLLKFNCNSLEVKILGPSPCMLSKIKSRYRFQIMLKSKKISCLQKTTKMSLEKYKIPTSIKLDIDIDPAIML
ncbi:MAG: primosomal protein N' [bacterium]|nr:primosomal protein N' [bacterium]